MNSRRQLLRFLGLGTVGAAGAVLAPRLAAAATDTLASRMIECAALRKEIDRVRIEWVAKHDQLKRIDQQMQDAASRIGKSEAVSDGGDRIYLEQQYQLFKRLSEVRRVYFIEDCRIEDRIWELEDRLDELERMPV